MEGTESSAVYENVISALKEELESLQTSPSENPLPPPSDVAKLKIGREFASPLQSIENFLTSQASILVLECTDPQVIMSWIIDTVDKVVEVKPSNHKRKLITAGTLIISTFDTNVEAHAIMPKGCKLVILHSKGNAPKLPKLTQTEVIFEKEELIRWVKLTQLYQQELLAKFKKHCGFEFPQCPEVLQGRALIRLIRTSATCEGFLFADIVYDHLEERSENLPVIVGDMDIKEEDVTEDLGKIAIKKLFPEWSRLLFSNENYRNMVAFERLMQANILRKTASDFEFVSDVVAHYCLANFLKSRENLRAFTRTILGLRPTSIKINNEESLESFEFHNKMLIYFLNLPLAPGEMLSLEACPTGDPDMTKIAMACVTGRFANLFGYILPRTGVVSMNLLELAVFTGSKNIAKMALMRGIQCGLDIMKPMTSSKTLLHVALQGGIFDMVELLLFDFNFKNELDKKHMNNLMHICVEGTVNMTQEEVKERITILKLLHAIDSPLLQRKYVSPKVGEVEPILSPQVHLKLIMTLVELGANIFARGKNGGSIAHLTAVGRSPQEYHQVIQYLLGLNSGLLQTVNVFESSPLHSAVILMDVSLDTIRLFEAVGFDVNSVNKNRSNLLHLAITFGRSLDFIKMLCNIGVNWNAKDSFEQSPLHLAVQEGNVEVIKHLLHLGADINETDKLGRTPLHYCFGYLKHPPNQHEIVKILLIAGADVNKKDIMYNTPLWYAKNTLDKGVVKQQTLKLMKNFKAKSCTWTAFMRNAVS